MADSTVATHDEELIAKLAGLANSFDKRLIGFGSDEVDKHRAEFLSAAAARLRELGAAPIGYAVIASDGRFCTTPWVGRQAAQDYADIRNSHDDDSLRPFEVVALRVARYPTTTGPET